MNEQVKAGCDRQDQIVREGELNKAALLRLAGVETSLSSVFAMQLSGKDYIKLQPKHADEASVLLHEILHALGQRKAKKRFEEYTGKVEFVITYPNGEVIITSAPPRCEIEEYEVTEEVPARTETYKKFRLKNPEECLGIKAEEPKHE